ncbi:DUF2892 domain-containing protein [Natronococcus pandeyae]|uniref:DUF2892 domain-containing protein n=1 Tax=Natronococcus pandeyae TaxID=2055836 RepID=A0A8J8PX65_9EURY|nr:DUF2892 domain-containing protein [Natronococcus pandeyae]TYL36506.1 DUF2892 domain-containing protein [Natronococcus pandeyae]
MQPNVGGMDRNARIVIGTVLVLAGIATLVGFWEIGLIVTGVALLVGAVLLVTGATRKCPINEAAGIDTSE